MSNCHQTELPARAYSVLGTCINAAAVDIYDRDAVLSPSGRRRDGVCDELC